MIEIDFSKLRILTPARKGFAKGCADAVLISLALTRTNPPKSAEVMLHLVEGLTLTRFRGLAKSYHMETRSVGNFMVCRGFDGSVVFALKNVDKIYCRVYPESLMMESSLKSLSPKAKAALEQELTTLMLERAAGQKIRFFNAYGYEKPEPCATTCWIPNLSLDNDLRSATSKFLTIFATVYYHQAQLGLIERVDNPYFHISLPLRMRDGLGNTVWSQPSCSIQKEQNVGYKKIPAIKSDHAFCMQAARFAATHGAIMENPASGDANRLTLAHARSEKRYCEANLLTHASQTYSIQEKLIGNLTSHDMMQIMAKWNKTDS